MSTRKIKNAVNNTTGELIYFKGHAKATFMSDGSTVEDAINNIESKIDLSDYVKSEELKGYAKTEDIPSLEGYVKTEDIPSLDGLATEDFVTSQGFLTEIPLEYVTDSELNAKNYATISDLDSIDFDHINNTPFTNDESGELNITDEQGNIGIKLSEDGIYVKDVIAGEHILSNKQDSLISGSNIKTINGESILGEGNIVVEEYLSEYAKKSEIPTKTSDLVNDSGFLVDDIYPDGVYAVTANEELINYTTADESCIGVALIAGEHKFMITKEDATNDGSNYKLYWRSDDLGGELEAIYDTVDGTHGYGYLGGTSTPQLDKNFTNWKYGTLSDFNGKANTEFITTLSNNEKDMCVVLNTFNNGTNSKNNYEYNDWYVPACGQLALMYLNLSEINTALTKIGGIEITNDKYQSSTWYPYNYVCYIDFNEGAIKGGDSRGSLGERRVRFIRDISFAKSLKERVDDLESSKQNTLISGTNIKTINGESILGEGNIVVEEYLSEYAKKSEIPTKTSQLTNDSGFISDDVFYDGAYGVKPNGSLCPIDEIDSSCIALAIISGDQKFWIEKSGPSGNTAQTYGTTFIWGSSEDDISGIPNISDNTEDFNGKSNTEAFINQTTTLTEDTTIFEYCRKFNNSDESLGYSDWYIPSKDQLALILSSSYGYSTFQGAMRHINGGWGNTSYIDDKYWSSSEKSTTQAWMYCLDDFSGLGIVNKSTKGYCILIRDFEVKTIKERISILEEKVNNLSSTNGSSEANVKAVDTGDILDDVSVNYATTEYVDSVLGDINSILESIINGGKNMITFYLKTSMNPSDSPLELSAEEGMTWEEWIDSEYNSIENFNVKTNDYIYYGDSDNINYEGGAHVTKMDLIISNYQYKVGLSTTPN